MLVTCPECQTKISDKLDCCPECGYGSSQLRPARWILMVGLALFLGIAPWALYLMLMAQRVRGR